MFRLTEPRGEKYWGLRSFVNSLLGVWISDDPGRGFGVEAQDGGTVGAGRPRFRLGVNQRDG